MGRCCRLPLKSSATRSFLIHPLSLFLSFLPSLLLSCFRKKAERGRIYFTNLQSKENTPSMINPKPCGHLCCCVIRGCEEVGGELEVLAVWHRGA